MAKKETFSVNINFLQDSINQFKEKLKSTEAELKQVNSAASAVEYGQKFKNQITATIEKLKEQKAAVDDISKAVKIVGSEQDYKKVERDLLKLHSTLGKSSKDLERYRQALLQVPNGASSMAKQIIAEFKVLGVEASKIKEYKGYLSKLVKEDDIGRLVAFNSDLSKTLSLLRQLDKAEKRLSLVSPKLEVDKSIIEGNKANIGKTRSFITQDVETPNLVHNKTITDRNLMNISDELATLKKRQAYLTKIEKLEQDITQIVDGRRARGHSNAIQKVKNDLLSKEKVDVLKIDKTLSEQENTIKNIITFEREKAKILKDITKLEKLENELVSDTLKTKFKADIEKAKSQIKSSKAIQDLEKEKIALAEISAKYKITNKYSELSHKYLNKIATLEAEINKIKDDSLKNEKLSELSSLKVAAAKLKDKQASIQINETYQNINKSVKDRLKLEREVETELAKMEKRQTAYLEKAEMLSKIGRAKIDNFASVYGTKNTEDVNKRFNTKVADFYDAKTIKEQEEALKELMLYSKQLQQEFSKIKLSTDIDKEFSKLEKEIENTNMLLDTMAAKLNKPELQQMKLTVPSKENISTTSIKDTRQGLKEVEKKVELYRQVEAEIAKIDNETAKYAAHLGLSTDKIEEQKQALKQVQSEILQAGNNYQKIVASVRQAKTEAQQFMNKLKPSKDLAADYDRFLNGINQKMATLQARIQSRMATGDTTAIKEAEKLLQEYQKLKVEAENAKKSLYSAINTSNGGLSSEQLKKYSSELKKMRFTTDENVTSLTDLNNKLIAVNSNLNQNSPLKLAHGMAFRAVVYMGLYSAMNNVLQLMKNGVAVVFDFDKNIKTMAAVFDLTTHRAGALHHSLVNLGKVYGGLLPDIEEAALALGRAGVEADKLVRATEAVMKMAKLTGDTIESSASAIITYLQVFGKDHSIETLGDELAYVANQSRLSTIDINTFSNYALAAAKSANITVEAVNAMAVAFSNAGLNASTIGTQIRKFTSLTLDNSTAVQNFFLKIGVSQDMLRASLNSGARNSNAALISLVGQLKSMTDSQFQEAISGMNILSAQTVTLLRNNADAFKEHLTKLQEGVQGELNKADLIAESYEANWQKMTISISVAFDKLTKKIFPMVDNWAKKFTKFINNLTDNWDVFVAKFEKATLTMGTVLLSVFGISAISSLTRGIMMISASIKGLITTETLAVAVTNKLKMALTLLARHPIIIALTVLTSGFVYASDAITGTTDKVTTLSSEFTALDTNSSSSINGLKNNLKTLDVQIQSTIDKYKGLKEQISLIRSQAMDGLTNPEQAKGKIQDLNYKIQLTAYDLEIKQKTKDITDKQVQLDQKKNALIIETNKIKRKALKDEIQQIKDSIKLQKLYLNVLKAKKEVYIDTKGKGVTPDELNSLVQVKALQDKLNKDLKTKIKLYDDLKFKITAMYREAHATNDTGKKSTLYAQIKQLRAERALLGKEILQIRTEIQNNYKKLGDNTAINFSATKMKKALDDYNKALTELQNKASKTKSVSPFTLDFSQVDKYIAYIGTIKKSHTEMAKSLSSNLEVAIDEAEKRDIKRFKVMWSNSIKTFGLQSDMINKNAKAKYKATLRSIAEIKDVNKALKELYSFKLKIAHTPIFKDNGQAKALLKIVTDMINTRVEWEKRKAKLSKTEDYTSNPHLLHFSAKFNQTSFDNMMKQVNNFKRTVTSQKAFTFDIKVGKEKTDRDSSLLFGIYNPDDIGQILNKTKFVNDTQLEMAKTLYSKIKKERQVLTEYNVELINNKNLKKQKEDIVSQIAFYKSQIQELKDELSDGTDIGNTIFKKSTLKELQTNLERTKTELTQINGKLKGSDTLIQKQLLSVKKIKGNYGYMITLMDTILRKNNEVIEQNITEIGILKEKLAVLNEQGKVGVKTKAEQIEAQEKIKGLNSQISGLEKEVNTREKQSVQLLKQKLQYEKQIAEAKQKYIAMGVMKSKETNQPEYDYNTYKQNRIRYATVDNVLPADKAVDVKQKMFDQQMNKPKDDTFGVMGGNYFGMDANSTAETFKQRTAQVKAFYDNKIDLAKKAGASEMKIHELYNEKAKKLEVEKSHAVTNLALQGAAMLGQQLSATLDAAYQAGWLKAKDMAKLMKAMKIAQIAMSTASAAMAGWELGMKYGSITGNAAAGTTIAHTMVGMSLTMGAIQMAAALATKYHTGGIVGTTSPTGVGGLKDNEISAVLEKGEYVLTAKEANNLKNVNKVLGGQGGGDTKSAPAQKTENVIINTVDRSVISKWASSREGRDVIHNVVNN